MPPITVMIMTLNEVNNIEEAIRSFPAETKIVVYDSFSTDGTVEKAEALGAVVVQRKFDNWAGHQNWGAANIRFENPWVYYSDADERMTAGLWDEIVKAAERAGEEAAYDIRRKDMFLGRWIKRSSFYPCWFTRLYRPERIRWERLVNPVSVVDGKVGRLQEHFLHYPFSKGIGFWFERHIKYADFEAQEMLRVMDEGVGAGALASGNPQDRRRALKRIFYRMPFRPLVKFFVLYFLRGGFLDGRAGFYYATMQSCYEFMISLRAKEIVRLKAGLPV